MLKLIFSCQWGKDKKKSWSGTHWALYETLLRHFDIIDNNLGYWHTRNILDKAFWLAEKIICRLQLISVSKLWWHIIKKKYMKKFDSVNAPIFAFTEYPDLKERKQYIFLDLHVGYLKKILKDEPELYSICGFRFTEKYVKLRELKQEEYLRRATAIFTMGKWLKEEIHKDYGIPNEQIFAVGGGCNIDLLKIDISKKSNNKILFVGRDFVRKGGLLVLEAFKKVRINNSDCELFIAGPKTALIKMNGVHWLGDVSYEDLAYYFNMCNLFCMPSRFEAYGLVFGEALIYGLPCIGRDLYEMKYIIEDGINGYLLREENSDELAKLIEKALSNKEMQMRVRNNQNNYIDIYSWDNVAKKIASVINSNTV